MLKFGEHGNQNSFSLQANFFLEMNSLAQISRLPSEAHEHFANLISLIRMRPFWTAASKLRKPKVHANETQKNPALFADVNNFLVHGYAPVQCGNYTIRRVVSGHVSDPTPKLRR